MIDQQIVVGIDASNIRLGGGVTHLREILASFNAEAHSIKKIILWAGSDTLSEIEDSPWLIKKNPQALNSGLLRRILWQIFSLDAEARENFCSVIFVPGGSYVGNFHPVVTMCQNLLPFERREIFRNGISAFSLKMVFLRLIQGASFKRSEGVIFLTNYSKNRILNCVGALKGEGIVISHGFNKAFLRPYKDYAIENKSTSGLSFKLIYVSNIASYKNQLNVLEAIRILREEGHLIEIVFIGPGERTYQNKFLKKLLSLDPLGGWTKFLGQISENKLASFYASSDIAVYASSCEAFGIILLEKMASSLPVACSNQSSMPELLKGGGIYFDPDSPLSIAAAIRDYITSPALRAEKRSIGFDLAQEYSWERCSKITFSFVEKISKDFNR